MTDDLSWIPPWPTSFDKVQIKPSERLSAMQIERAAEALRAYEFQHIEGVLEGTRAWENLNEKIKQHFRGKVRVVVDAVGEA